MNRTMTRRGVLNAGAAAGVLVALDACGGRKEPPTNKAVDKARFLTGFGTTPRECYAWVGKGKGFFAEVNIDLDVAAGQPSDANLKTLAGGKADLAAVDYVSAVRGVSNPAYSYRAVMAVQGQTLLSMITLPGRGVTVPHDLVGRTLGTAPAAATQTLFPSYAKLAGFDPATIKFVNFGSDQLPAVLASGQIAAMGGYAIDTPAIQAAAKGVLPVVFPYGNVMTDLYGTVIVARLDLIRQKPDLVKRFCAAMWKGIRYAVDNPSEAGTLVHTAVPTVSADIMATTMQLMHPYVTSPQFDQARIARGIALLQQAGLADQGLSTTPDRVVDLRSAPTEA